MEETLRQHGGTASCDSVPLVRSLPEFESFYAREYEAVAALALALSGSRIVSDDLAQEAFLAAYRRWGEIGLYDNPGAWVRRAVANRSVSVFRRNLVHAKAVVRLGSSLDPIPDMSAETVDLWREVRRLPRRQAQAVALFYLEDLSLEQISEVLDCAVETVRTHLRRGRKSLARQLNAEEEANDVR